MFPKLKIEIEVFKDNKRIYHMPLRNSHTWVRNMYNWYISALSGGYINDPTTFADGYLNIKTTAGTVTTSTTNAGNLDIDNAAAASIFRGIVVGSGTTAESIDSFKLTTQIISGTGAGQLSYAAATTTTGTWVGGVITVTQGRYFNNNSGGAVDVNETGIYAYFGSVTSWPALLSVGFMICRDKLADTVSVPNAAQLNVMYQISFDCSP
jgi:hypothetical protein